MAAYTGSLPKTITGSTYTSVEVDNQTIAGDLSNAGTLSGATTGISVVDSTITGAIIDTGIVAPAAGGVGISIDSHSKITGATFALDIGGATLTGGIVNAGTLTVTDKTATAIFVGDLNGVNTVSLFSGGISNAGAISATASIADGIVVGGIATKAGSNDALSSFSGGINNTGSISAGNVGVVVGGFGLNGGVVDLVSFAGGIDNSGGTISAGNIGIQVGGFVSAGGAVTVSSFGGGIDNSGGTISAGGGIVVGGTAISGGSITISDFSGGITNTGNISATIGIGIGGRGNVASSFVTVSTFSGGISNSGTISGSFIGIAIGGHAAGSNVVVTVSDFSGDVTNSGVISAGNFGISVDDVQTFAGAIDNSGNIIVSTGNGAYTGIGLFGIGSFSGGIDNSGSISGDRGINLNIIGSFNDGIVNSGTISGTNAGIDLSDIANFSGGITNSGSISGDAGIDVFSVSNFSGTIDNESGHTISASAVGIGVSNVGQFDPTPGSGGIVNAGAISVAFGNGVFVGAYGYAGNSSNIMQTGISAFSGGITNAGTITAGGDGIFVGGNAQSRSAVTISTFAGDIVNSHGGTISANFDGILVGGDAANGGFVTVSSFSGAVVNAGNITAGNDGIVVGGQATVLDFSSGITNTGTISVLNFGDGILVGGNPYPGNSSSEVSAFFGGITNSGTITTSGTGVAVGGGAPNTGETVIVSTFSGGISNTSTIDGGAIGILVGGYASGNQAAAAALPAVGPDLTLSISKPAGSVTVSSFSGDIVNSTGAMISGGQGIVVGGNANNGGVVTVSTFTGDIVNATGATISANYDGILVGGDAQSGGVVTVSNFSGAIINAGNITASNDGIVVGGQATVLDFSGGITNTGAVSVTSFGDGILVGGSPFTGSPFAEVSQFSGGITNAGTISAGAINTNATDIAVGGNASGSGDAVTVFAFSGGITNTGTLSASGDGILVGGYANGLGSVTVATFSGNIVNYTGGIINAGRTGIEVGGFGSGGGSVTVSTFSGDIINAGTISAGNAGFGDGILVGAAASSGSVVSVLNFDGGITNSGAISANGNGIQSENVENFTGSIVNATGATISAGGFGIGIDVVLSAGDTFSGGVTNNGAITAGHDGIVVDSGLSDAFLGGITNTGTVTAANGTGIDVANVATFDGGITNTGTISGTVGINALGESDVSIFDSGTIIGTGGTAIELGAGDTLTLAPGYTLDGTINDFFSGDTIDLTGVTGGSAGTATLLAGNELQIVEGSNTYDLYFDPNQNFLGDSFVLGSDRSGGTTVTLGSAATPAAQLVVSIDGGSVASGVVTQSTGGDPIASSYNAFLAFGDSDIDSGYFFTHTFSTYSPVETLYQGAVAGGGGLPTTIGSLMNSVQLADYIGQTAIPIGELGGTNYAASGATILGSLPGSQAPSIVDQIDSYLASVGNVADPNGLYLFSGGGNDATEATILYPSGNSTDIADQISYMQSEANAFAAALEQLHADGAQHILIDDFNGPGALGAAFNTTLWADLNSTGTPFLVYNADAVVSAIMANPAGYNAATGSDIVYTTPYVLGGQVAVSNPDPANFPSGWSLLGTPADQQPNATTQYLWADNLHLAGAGQTAEANYAENLINTGVPTVGETLTANPAETTGLNSSIPAFGTTYQWQHEIGGIWQNISGATGRTYTIQKSDVGAPLRVEAFDNSLNAISAQTEDVACYCPGTLIRAEVGDVPVEDLAIGDRVMTASGALRPIKWIGKRSYSGRSVRGRKDILPVCIKAGALEDNVPKRDLWISPNHAMFLDGMLIEAKDLINGVSVLRAASVESVEYFHIELDNHDVIIAEGALAESFIDDDSRDLFHNADEHRRLYPDTAKEAAQYCAPRLQEGYEVEAVRRRIAMRAGLDEAVPVGNLRGHVDRITAKCVAGWAQNLDHPEAPVCLDIVVGGVLVGRVLANRYRKDLQTAGTGSGRHSFEFKLPPKLVFAPEDVEVRRSLDGVALELTTEAQRTLRHRAGRRRAA